MCASTNVKIGYFWNGRPKCEHDGDSDLPPRVPKMICAKEMDEHFRILFERLSVERADVGNSTFDGWMLCDVKY